MKIRITIDVEVIIVEDFDDDTQEEDSYPETFLAGQVVEVEDVGGWFEWSKGGVFLLDPDQYEVIS